MRREREPWERTPPLEPTPRPRPRSSKPARLGVDVDSDPGAVWIQRHPEPWELEYWARAGRKLFGVADSPDGRRTVYRVGTCERDAGAPPARQGALW